MLTQFKKYPIDTTGTLKDNLIVNEHHEIDPLHRALVTREGPFFGGSMVVRKDGNPLVHGRDYRHDDLHPVATKASNQDVFTSIILLREDLMGEVFLTYQAYGKEDDFTPDYIRQLVKEATQQNITKWAGVLNKPQTFPPAPHTHPITDVIYWNSVVEQLRKMVSVLEHLRLTRDSWLYGQFGQFQTEVSKRLEAFETIASNANTLVGGIEKFKVDSTAALRDLEARINALQSTNELQAYLNQMKRDIDAELEKFRKSSSDLEKKLAKDLSDQLAQLKIDVATKLTQEQVVQLINGSIGDFVTNSVLNNRLTTLATKSEVNTLRAEVSAKADDAAIRLLIAEAAKTAQWRNLADKPKVVTHDEKNRITGDLNDINSYIYPGTYTIGSQVRNIPLLRQHSLANNQTSNGLLEVIGDKESGVIYQRYIVDGNTYTRQGRVQGEFVTFPNRWNKSIHCLDNSISENIFAQTESMVFQIGNNWATPPLHMPSLAKVGDNFPLPQPAERLDGNGILLGGSGQRTMLYSYGHGDNYIATNDNDIGTNQYNAVSGWKLEKLITSKVLESEFPYIWTVGKDVDGLKTRLDKIENGQTDVLGADRVQSSVSDIANGKLVRLFENGQISVKQVRLIGGSNPTFQVKEDGHVYLDAKFRPKEINLTSDKRLKADIRRIENSLEKVAKLGGYTYRMVGEKEQTAGLIAQEVLEVLPCAVSEDKNGFLSLNYNALIPLLLEAVKEQQEKITQLELLVNELLVKEK